MIGFIGVGKVGTSLCKYFLLNNLEISGIFDSNSDFLTESANFLNVKCYDTMYSLISDSEIIFITTNDKNISSVWNDINTFPYNDKIFIHCSGSLSSEILSSKNNYAYSLHPMFPFADKFESYKNLSDLYFSLEGDEKHLFKVKNIIEAIGNKVILISKTNKAKYHLANVMVSNLVLSLINKGVIYLEECGVDSGLAKEALTPLIMSNIDNIINNSFENAITGPVERADTETVSKHIEIISKSNSKGDLEIYKNLSMNLIEIGKNKNKNYDYSEMIEILRSDK